MAASLTLLATQVNVPQLGLGNVAAADPALASSTVQYEVKLNTNSADAIQIVAPNKPDYDAEVLTPLHAAQAEAAAKAAAAAAAAKKRRKVIVAPLAVTVTGSHSDWMAAAGIAESDFGYVDYIVDHESGWGVTKSNYSGSGAYGLGQAYPASKMAPYGADYLTNPVTQLKWANAYATSHYGSWANAYAHWLTYHRW
ncbi:MAG TPA: hypothetical protein VGH44_06785 [Candidatus Saccharimonadia bacterium]